MPGAGSAAAAVRIGKAAFYFLRQVTTSGFGHTRTSRITTELLYTSRIGFLPDEAQAATGTALFTALLIKCFSQSSDSTANISSSMEAFLGLSSGLTLSTHSICL